MYSVTMSHTKDPSKVSMTSEKSIGTRHTIMVLANNPELTRQYVLFQGKNGRDNSIKQKGRQLIVDEAAKIRKKKEMMKQEKIDRSFTQRVSKFVKSFFKRQ